jgi:hypothetical protein
VLSGQAGPGFGVNRSEGSLRDESRACGHARSHPKRRRGRKTMHPHSGACSKPRPHGEVAHPTRRPPAPAGRFGRDPAWLPQPGSPHPPAASAWAAWRAGLRAAHPGPGTPTRVHRRGRLCGRRLAGGYLPKYTVLSHLGHLEAMVDAPGKSAPSARARPRVVARVSPARPPPVPRPPLAVHWSCGRGGASGARPPEDAGCRGRLGRGAPARDYKTCLAPLTRERGGWHRALPGFPWQCPGS